MRHPVAFFIRYSPRPLKNGFQHTLVVNEIGLSVSGPTEPEQGLDHPAGVAFLGMFKVDSNGFHIIHAEPV